MRWFYAIAGVLVVGLSLAPFLLLKEKKIPGASDAESNRVVVYSSYGSKVRSLDPATCGDAISAMVQGNVYEALYGYHYLKRPVEVVPVLAEDMPHVSADGLAYTIRLKKGVPYHRNECFGRDADGSPSTRMVEANDFVLAFKRIADYHISTPVSLALIEDRLAGLKEYRDRTQAYEPGDFSRYDLPLEGVTAVDEHTLQIRLTAPLPQLLYILALPHYVPIPREVIDYYLCKRDDGRGGREDIPRKDCRPQISDFHAAVGTGAYYLADFVPGGNIVLGRNDDYREDFYPGEGAPGDAEAGLLNDAGRRVPFVDVHVLQYVPEDNTAWGLFLSRRTDISGIPRHVYGMAVGPSRRLADPLARQGIRLVTYADPAVYWYAFNLADPVLGRSKSLRQAICLGFNVEQYIEVLYNGRGRRAVNTVPSGFAEQKQLPESPYARYDLAAAREKLAQAREELDQAGVIRPGEPIPPLTIDLGGRDEEDRRVGEFARIQFQRLGLQLKVELNDRPTLQDRIQNKQVQIFAAGRRAIYDDPVDFLQLYYSPNIRRGTNHCNYANDTFDRLYERAAAMAPSPQRTETYKQMVSILNEDCPAVLLSEPISLILVHPWVHNVKPHPVGYGLLKYRRVDVEARRAAGGQ